MSNISAPDSERVEASELCKWDDLPTLAHEAVVTELLAKTYVKEGLSKLDRYHAKLGDIGIKAMKKAMPNLKIPKKYRCECCIDAKMHKFGHSRVPVEGRIKYAPGTCIHSDHSGPYARSIGGCRYSQLYMDMGSGFLWAVRMAKKSGHYDATPRVIADARAASGKRLQYFQSDGEGVFASGETDSLCQAEKVRHQWSAPHDSNSNPFIERARRTIFEGTATSLLRSGAPSNFWGEAENHKVYTMNVLPSVEDPEQKGKFLSKKNLLEGNKRPTNLERLMAFGTAATCYVPKGQRVGGKAPGQRRSFKGAIVGYETNMEAYRVWDLADKQIRIVSYYWVICHEGFYPFKDRSKWPPDWLALPPSFAPTVGSVLDTTEWYSYEFDDDESNEVLSRLPVPDGTPLPPRVGLRRG
jgi:hypothetical protein